MGRRFFTSDWHLNSKLIVKYASRFQGERAMSDHAIVEKCNEIAKSDDVVIHLGDFCLSGFDRHGDEVDDATGCPSSEAWLKQIQAKMFLIAGNHDDGHSDFKSMAKSLTLDLNKKWKNVFASHFPSDHELYAGPIGTEEAMQVVLCGHVHDAWLVKWDEAKHVININVGVDVWNYKPVCDAELTRLLDFLWDAELSVDDTMTRAQFEQFRRANCALVAANRKKRKEENLKKRGLTKEECERKRIEAMKKKGLL